MGQFLIKAEVRVLCSSAVKYGIVERGMVCTDPFTNPKPQKLNNTELRSYGVQPVGIVNCLWGTTTNTLLDLVISYASPIRQVR